MKHADPVTHVSILGTLWAIRPVPRAVLGAGVDGRCMDPDGANPEIQYYRGLRGKYRLDTILHELAHAIDFEKKHTWVENIAAAMTEALWEDGWRHVDEI